MGPSLLFLGPHGVPHTLEGLHAEIPAHPCGRGNNTGTTELFRVSGIERTVKSAAALRAGSHGIQGTRGPGGDLGYSRRRASSRPGRASADAFASPDTPFHILGKPG